MTAKVKNHSLNSRSRFNSKLSYDEFDDEYRDNGYYESNDDECYEFGGTSSDKKCSSKSLMNDFISAIPALVAIVAFCIGVFVFAFSR